MRVIAIDPGGSTGFATYDTREEKFHAWWEPWHEARATVHRRLADGKDSMPWNQLHVVIESFHISTQTGKKSPQGSLQAIELIGLTRYLSEVYMVPFKLQSPSEAKLFATDAKLKAMGWWTKGVDHPRDATRHLVLFLCTERLIDLQALHEALLAR